MGSKFHHAHVRTADVTAVVDALRERALANKFSLARDGEPSDYDVVIATSPASPEWTSIYNPFGHFMWELSEKLMTHVVELEIFDGDVLHARLSNDGCKVDVFCSNPDYADEPARALKGQPKRWDSLCVSGKSSRGVARVFKSAAENPEVALVELGRLIGLDERSLYPDDLDPAGANVRRLRFRNPPSEAPPSPRVSSPSRPSSIETRSARSSRAMMHRPLPRSRSRVSQPRAEGSTNRRPNRKPQITAQRSTSPSS